VWTSVILLLPICLKIVKRLILIPKIEPCVLKASLVEC